VLAYPLYSCTQLFTHFFNACVSCLLFTQLFLCTRISFTLFPQIFTPFSCASLSFLFFPQLFTPFPCTIIYFLLFCELFSPFPCASTSFLLFPQIFRSFPFATKSFLLSSQLLTHAYPFYKQLNDCVPLKELSYPFSSFSFILFRYFDNEISYTNL